ncbi:Chalcone isomerase [Phaffia rhodozyma]|uniref:Chalcone isomerase n=1 Tax=Phaffia rhodozyma TaxID=264483 RepID=A0A0F7SFK1_PHARH|nr:Chalcone isomerase [Phaffia rhodozyma]
MIRQVLRSTSKLSYVAGPRVAPVAARWVRPSGAVIGLAALATTGWIVGSSLKDFEFAPTRLLSVLELEAPPPSNVKIDSSTSLPFPLSILPKSLQSASPSSAPLALVGLGVRTVSFLRVKVYAAGFYAPKGTWWEKPGMGSEASMKEFLESDQPCVLRIVPTRNTGFDHLRDGFVRAIQARVKLLSKASQMSESEAEAIESALTPFKAMFPKRSAAKGEELLLIRLSSGELVVEFEGEILGKVQEKAIGKLLMIGYFLDDGKEISPVLKNSVLQGFQQGGQVA